MPAWLIAGNERAQRHAAAVANLAAAATTTSAAASASPIFDFECDPNSMFDTDVLRILREIEFKVRGSDESSDFSAVRKSRRLSISSGSPSVTTTMSTVSAASADSMEVESMKPSVDHQQIGMFN